MMTVWFDRIRACVGWSPTDRERIARLRDCLDSDLDVIIESLGEQLAQLKGTQPLMANARFVRRLYSILREWLTGLLDGTFDEDYAQARWRFGQRMAEADLTFEDLILLEALARERLAELARKHLDGHSRTISSTLHTLEKALCLDLALVHSGYLHVHDTQMERELLDRFLTVTGFSRTLYENLAETRGQNREG